MAGRPTSPVRQPDRTSPRDPMDPPHASLRRHELDALRAFAMLLGIALHAAMSFTGVPWTVQDPQTSGLFYGLVSAVHGFRMPLFFLLSGYFTAMLWQRRGLLALVSDRLRRVFLPLVLGSLTVIPLMHGVGLWATKRAAQAPEAARLAPAPDLWRASAAGDRARVAALIEAGADPDARDLGTGATALSLAAGSGHVALVQQLLAGGADVQATDRDGSTALHAAAYLGKSAVAALLLEAGIDAQRRNRRGHTALDATRADPRTTRHVAVMHAATIDRQQLPADRQQIRRLLGVDSVEPEPGRLQRLWWFLTLFPVFHHLWFLWFLCWMVAGFALWKRLAPGTAAEAVPRPWVESARRYLWLVPLTMLPAWFMGRDMPVFGPDTSSSLLPPLHLLAYYTVFFGFGALCFGGPLGIDGMGKRWWLALPLALFVLFPAGMVLVHDGDPRWWPLAVLCHVLYAWAMCAAMMGLFRQLVSMRRAWVRYLSDASYWMYLMHLPLVIVLQAWLRDWPLAPGWKFALICVAVAAVLLLSYETLVRRSWIGALLNGRRHAPGGGQPAGR
jgi:peptidoglycan/LPS O-acetylase OafA/YrhL